ncbi:MAG: nitrous oxide reductase family maturation protein NosD [Candidatus Heimdallarchaeota archaeon]
MKKASVMLFVVCFLLFFYPNFIKTEFSVSIASPPTNGDWVIDNETIIVENQSIILNGSLLLQNKANMTLRNVTLRMNSPTDQHYRIEIADGCSLTIEGNSSVTAVTPSDQWYLKAVAGSSISLKDSWFSNAGYDNNDFTGLRIQAAKTEIINCTITENFNGIDLLQANHSLIANNTIINSTDTGIHLFNSHNNVVTGNRISGGTHGINTALSSNITIQGNIIFETLENFGIAASSCYGNITVRNNFVTGSYYGIYFSQVPESVVSHNTLLNNRDGGIVLSRSFNNTVHNNDLTGDGIEITSCSSSTIDQNTVRNAGHGISLRESIDAITGIYESTNMSVTRNIITDNFGYGIYIDSTTSNATLWGNTLGANGEGNAYDGNGENQWDNGTHGNWWDDYYGPDWDWNSIGDLPYKISGGQSQDRYPIMNLTDVIAPSVNSLSPVTVEEGAVGKSITWNPTDTNPYWYNITDNSTLLAQGLWNGSAITINLDKLTLGMHHLTLTVFDRLGNYAESYVYITVIPESTKDPEEDSSTVYSFSYLTILLAMLTILVAKKRN